MVNSLGQHETILFVLSCPAHMDINQTAEYLGVSHKTVRRYVKAGKLKVIYIDGKGVYDKSEVEELKKDKQTPIHRAIPIPDNATSTQVDTKGQITLSQVVPLEKMAQSLQIFEQYYGLQFLKLKLTLTVEEASKVSGLSKTGLKRDAKSGILKAIKQGGRWRIRPQDLQEYVKCLYGEAGILRN